MNHLKNARKEKKQKQERINAVSSLKEAITKIEELEAYVEAIRSLRKTHTAHVIKPLEGTGTSEAVAVALGTDWHVGSIVDPKTVNGLNKFNVAIAKKRIANFFERIVRLTKKERQDVKIAELILFLGGDLIDGALHLDTIMSNEISEPINQAVVCQDQIEAGLNFLLEFGNYKKITVVCADGNHGRITAKQHFNSRQGNALEYFMYYNIAARFPQINWIFADGLHAYVPVYDYVIRFHHGDTISFGGVNGPYTYLNRRIYQWDQAHKADYSCQGHLHCYTIGTRRWLINGSLIGYSPYAVGLGGEYQPPIQSFFLVDKKRFVTIQIPILLEG